MATGAVVARILSEYNAKGTKAAEKDIKRLGKQFDAFGKKVTKSFGLATAAATAFAVKLGKDSVKAYIEEAKSQALLANNLRNTVGATDEAIAAVEAYIDKTELLTNVQDTQLRESFSKLALAFNDINKATIVQGVALDVAAGTGKDLSVVTDAITKASQGNFTALKKLIPTLDENIVKNKDLGAALVYLQTTYKGSAQAAANTDPWTKLSIQFDRLRERIGEVLLPAFQQFADYITISIIPAIYKWINANEFRLQNSLMVVVNNIKEVVRAFTNIYNIIKGINNILPLGIGGWIQIGVALSIAGKAAALYSALLTGLGTVVMFTNKQLALNTAQLTANAAAQGANALGGQVMAISLARLAIAVKTYYTDAMIAAVNTANMSRAMAGATTSVNVLTAALLRLKAAFTATFAFLGKYFKQIALIGAALLAVGKAWDWLFGKDTIKLSEAAQKASFSMYMADKATQSMDDALNDYKATQDSVVKLSEEELALQEELRRLQAKSAADAKKAAAIAKKEAEIKARIEKKFGVLLTDQATYQTIQNKAIEKNLARSEKILELEELKTKTLLEQTRAKAAEEYNKQLEKQRDILQALAGDNKVTAEEIGRLAFMWKMSTEEAELYISSLIAVSDYKLDPEEIQKYASTWGMTTDQAKKYLQAVQVIQDGVISTAEVDKLKKEWNVTGSEVYRYLDFVLAVEDMTLTDEEVKALAGKWGMSNEEISKYLLQIGKPFNYHGSMLSGIDALIEKLKQALALMAQLQKGVTGTVPTPTVDGNSKAAIDAANAAAAAAAKAAADAAAALAESEEALKKSGYSQSAAAQIESLTALRAQTDPGTGINFLLKEHIDAIKDNTSIFTQIAQVDERDKLRAMGIIPPESVPSFDVGSFRMGEEKSMAGFSTPTASVDYDERFRFQAFNSSTMNTASGISSGNLMAGGANIVVNVAGNVTSEQDLVTAVRNGLLANQYNGSGLTLQAV